MRDDGRLHELRDRLDGLWARIRRVQEAERQESGQREGTLRRCSYCRTPGHYRPRCQQLADDLIKLRTDYTALEGELTAVKAQLRQTEADKQWWIDKAFKLQDEIEELRREINSIGVHAGPTRGR